MKHTLMIAAAVVAIAVVPLAYAQTAPPAQAQVQPAPAKPLTPGQQSYDQLDADLHALVASINARLQAVNDDMTQLRAHVDAPTAAPEHHLSHPGLAPKPGTGKP